MQCRPELDRASSLSETMQTSLTVQCLQTVTGAKWKNPDVIGFRDRLGTRPTASFRLGIPSTRLLSFPSFASVLQKRKGGIPATLSPELILANRATPPWRWYPPPAPRLKPRVRLARRTGSRSSAPSRTPRKTPEPKLGRHHGGPERQETAASRAERLLAEELKRRGWTSGQLTGRRKGNREKVKIARRLRKETTMALDWIAQRLNMGAAGYAAHCLRQTQ